MKYFLLHTDPQYTTAPDLLDWRDKIDPRYIRKGGPTGCPSGNSC